MATPPDEQSITFHIIYLPGSVTSLLPLLHSLLHWSHCHFVVVGNGTTAAEDNSLRQLAAQQPRISLRFLGRAQRPLLHSQVLSRLLRDSTDEYFAFLDSDIVADGPFMPELLGALTTADAVFSGRPVGLTREQTTLSTDGVNLFGAHSHTWAGPVPGSTFMAIVRRSTLERGSAASSVGLERAIWYELSRRNRQLLQQQGLRFFSYDTARVAYSLLLAQGVVFAWADPPNLHHLGGYSRRKQRRHSGWARLLQRQLKLQLKLHLLVAWRLFAQWYCRRYRIHRSSLRDDITAMDALTQPLSRYFSQLIKAHVGSTAVPAAYRSGNDEMDSRIARAAAAISAAWELAARR